MCLWVLCFYVVTYLQHWPIDLAHWELHHGLIWYWSSTAAEQNDVWSSLFTSPHQPRGATSSSFRGGAIFTKFHSMTSSCLFNRGTTFSQTATYINNVFLPAETKSIVQRHTFSPTLVNKQTKQNRTFDNSAGGCITSVKRNFWLHALCACTEQHSTYQIRWENWWLGLRIWCLGKCVG